MRIALCNEVIARKTLDVMRALIDQCAELGGRYLVHGSPHQRRVDAGDTREAALARAQECFAGIAERAEKAGIVYCIEPLASEQTPLINTLAKAAKLVKAIGSKSVRTMLDCSAAGCMEKGITRGVGRQMATQGSDRARAGQRPQPPWPGPGRAALRAAARGLVRHKYAGDIAVEPFDYVPDGPI